MKYLLDTNIVIRLLSDKPPLDTQIVEFIERHPSQVSVSTISAWEIAIKVGLNKLKVDNDPVQFLADQGFELITINLDDITKLRQLPGHHKDPFDRMLIAQAQSRQWGIITSDEVFNSYAVKVMMVK